MVKPNPVAGGATVSVASKMPFDFTLRIYDFKDRFETIVTGGTRKYKQAEPRFGSPEFVVKGNSVPARGSFSNEISSGYAITRDIPKAFWDEWLSQNAEASYVLNNMIFAHEEHASVVAMALDNEHLKSGMERLDPQNLPKSIQSAKAT